MGARANLVWAWWQGSLCTVKGLTLAFLVAAQHKSPFRRVDPEALLPVDNDRAVEAHSTGRLLLIEAGDAVEHDPGPSHVTLWGCGPINCAMKLLFLGLFLSACRRASFLHGSPTSWQS
jgi:hypothetical protein